ncbi:MAG: DUF3788 family protein [Planctomycetota bacterium]
MDQPLFPDKSQAPDDAVLTKALGRARRAWDSLVEHAQALQPSATPEWKYYSSKAGWTFVVRGPRHNLLYLSPQRGRFKLSLTYGERAVAAAEHADLPPETLQLVRESPKYPEGRAIRMEVVSAADAAIARKLLDIKLAQ